jgi:arylsulfatase A-like enzyme
MSLHSHRFRKPHPWTAAALLALLATVFAANCRTGETAREQPPILFISLDTLRWDALGATREGRPSLTPNLDRFVADSVLMTKAVVPMPFTLASHMSMFTGLYPQVHRVTTPQDSLSSRIQSLAELLQQDGYRTAGRVTNDWLKAEFGFGRGFEDYQRLPHRLTYSDRVNASAEEVLVQAAEDPRPLFLFLHYMDAHSDFFQQGRNRLPYYSPARFREGREVSQEDFCDDQGRCATQFLLEADREGRTLPAEQVEILRDLYESGIRYLDRDLGRLFDLLRDNDLYDRSLIVLTSDHGEEFQEHGKFLHSQIYDESVRVDLIFKLPQQHLAGTRIDTQVEVVDLLPTILDLVGLQASGPLQGKSLLPMMRGEAVEARTALSQNKLNRMRFALRTESHKIIHDLKEGTSEVYDLRDDPGETINLAESDPELAERLRKQLMEKVRENRRLAQDLESEAAEKQTAEDSVLTKEEQERLEALGYIQ